MKRILFVISIVLAFCSTLFGQNINVLFPNGNEHFAKNVAAPHNIIWTSDSLTTYKIEFSNDSGNSWVLIAENISDTFYTWAPDTISEMCLIKISDSSNSFYDQSDTFFSVVERHNYYALWSTSMGDFRAVLRNDLVPIASQNFINLAERNFYDNLIFHRVISGFMIQDGDPLGTGEGGPGYEFNDEIVPQLTHSFPGVLAMANAGPNTNGSQYYITVDQTSWLDGGYTIFGRIVDGMQVVYDISEVATDANDKPIVDVNIYSITISEANPMLELVYPTDSSSLIEGQEIMIQWQSEYVADLKIEYSIDGAKSWQSIIDSIPADNSQYLWRAPNNLSQNCFIRLSVLDSIIPAVQNTEPFEIRVKPIKLTRIELYENVEANAENPQNLVMPGKPFRFKIKILNDLNENLTDVNIVLKSESTNVQITDSICAAGAIDSKQEIWAEDYFEVLLPQNYLTDRNIKLYISASDDVLIDIPWISEFSIPQLSLFNFLGVDDDNIPDSQGNNNDIAQPGEIIELLPKIDNKSSDTVFQVYGQLVSLQNFVSVWNNIQGVDRIVFDTTKYKNFEPLFPNSTSNSPQNDFVFNYNSTNTYKIFFNLIATGFILEEQGTTFEDGGIKIKWGIPFTMNNNSPLGINDFAEKNEFYIIGNPSKDEIKFMLNYNKNFEITIYNMYGQSIYNQIFDNKNYNIYEILNLNLQNGMYIISISSENFRSSKKFIINN